MSGFPRNTYFAPFSTENGEPTLERATFFSCFLYDFWGGSGNAALAMVLRTGWGMFRALGSRYHVFVPYSGRVCLLWRSGGMSLAYSLHVIGD